MRGATAARVENPASEEEIQAATHVLTARTDNHAVYRDGTRKGLPVERSKCELQGAVWGVAYLAAYAASFLQGHRMLLLLLLEHLGQWQLDRGQRWVWPSVERLVRRCGYSERYIWRLLAELEEMGLIRRIRRPGQRTTVIDLSGYCAIAAEAKAALAAADAAARDPSMEDEIDGRVSIETELEFSHNRNSHQQTKNLKQTDALTREPSPGVGLTAAAGNDTLPDPIPPNADTAQPEPLLPKEASFEIGAEQGGPVPAERPIRQLLEAREACPSLARLLDAHQIETWPLDHLARLVREDYLEAVPGCRNPGHIWDWALNRHGPANAIIAWAIAQDTAGPDRNPAGWFTRFATAETTWNLASNLRRLRRQAPRPASDPATSPAAVAAAATDERGGPSAPRPRPSRGTARAVTIRPPQCDGAGRGGRHAAAQNSNLRLAACRRSPIMENRGKSPGNTAQVPGDRLGRQRREHCETTVSATTGTTPAPLDLLATRTAPASAGNPAHTPGGRPEAARKKPAPGDQSGNGRKACFVKEAGTASPHPPARSTPDGGGLSIDAFRDAWTAALARHIGPGRALAAWRAWLSEARLLDPGDGALRLVVKTAFARDHIRAQLAQPCDLAARTLGYPEGCEVIDGR